MKDRYWHIQMFLPEGKGGTKIDSSLMLKEEKAIIGTGDWDDIQCRHFKGEQDGLRIGDVIMVREGSRPLALCEIISNYFHSDELSNNYLNSWFRYVEVLDWADQDESSSLFSQGTLKKLYKTSDTRSWNYINEWYKKVLLRMKEQKTQKIVELLLNKNQIILQGAPGTGKTYLAKDIAEKMIFDNTISADKKVQSEKLKNNNQFKLVQFHPSYSYEDFVRGIVVNTDNGVAEYINQNKILGEFAREAYNNLLDSQKTEEEISKKEWVADQFEKFVDFISEKVVSNLEDNYQLTDHVNIIAVENDAFRYTGNNWKHGSNRMLFRDIIQAFLDGNKTRQDIKNNNNLSGLAKQHASYYIRALDHFREYLNDLKITYTDSSKNRVKLNNYVLIIDEINRANLSAVLGELLYALEYRGEIVESMYAIDGDNELILPSNLYIIGTMNTADRSVGQIDYAIRRRFAFVDMLPTILEVDGFDSDLFREISKLFIQNIEEYINDTTVILLPSDHLSSEFRPEDVWIGHSYFVMKDNRELRLKYEIIPILKEYLKDGILKDSAKEIIQNLV
ncbi:AAA family ATPase [Apibacter raozihei]|uniref:AAA family ATPase n=1 Tax=Apibacter raozihei TaxID=2500547 RepID=UPI000FE2C43A|nr:AAA family ATPase [Apibacter raozihei]